MSLVSYGSSDDDSETEEEISLPAAVKKAREPVKISIPSLNEFKEEVCEPEAKKKFQPKGGSGLFSLLPPPKNSTTASKPGFIPYIFSKKKENNPSTSSLEAHLKPKVPIAAKHQKPCVSPKSVPTAETDISDFDIPEDSPEPINYFSIDQTIFTPKPAVNESETFTSLQPSLSVIPALTSSPESIPVASEMSPTTSVSASDSLNNVDLPEETTETAYSSFESSVAEEDTQQNFLKDERFLKLKGKRGREEVNIIDVSGDDQLTGRDEWLMQSLTEEKVQRPSKRRHDMPTTQQKRKHQITYLAFQAKERELDLKNQWSLNSRTRRETQAKYGF